MLQKYSDIFNFTYECIYFCRIDSQFRLRGHRTQTILSLTDTCILFSQNVASYNWIALCEILLISENPLRNVFLTLVYPEIYDISACVYLIKQHVIYQRGQRAWNSIIAQCILVKILYTNEGHILLWNSSKIINIQLIIFQS